MTVHLEPHVEQDVGRYARVSQAADDVHEEAGEADRGEEDGDANERRRVAADHRPVDEVARQERQIQREGRAEAAHGRLETVLEGSDLPHQGGEAVDLGLAAGDGGLERFDRLRVVDRVPERVD